MKKTLLRGIFIMITLAVLMAFEYPSNTSVNSANLTSQAESTYRVEPCSMYNNAFQPGEEMTYKLYYNWNFVWVAAGEVTFKVNDLGDLYHFSAQGRTYSSYEWFYKVRDRYDTYVDKKTLLPVTSIRDVQEGKYRLYDKITFDQQGKKSSVFAGEIKRYCDSDGIQD
jgi:hypothetical protein